MDSLAPCRLAELRAAKDSCFASASQCKSSDLVNFYKIHLCYITSMEGLVVLQLLGLLLIGTLFYYLVNRFYTQSIASFIETFEMKRISAAVILVPIINVLPELIRLAFDTRKLSFGAQSSLPMFILAMPLTLGFFFYFRSCPTVLGIAKSPLTRELTMVSLHVSLTIVFYYLYERAGVFVYLGVSVAMLTAYLVWSIFVKTRSSYQINQQVCRLTRRILGT